MALNPADIATVSRLLDEALALEPAGREAWLAALPAEHRRHADALRDMLAQQARLDTDDPLQTMPKLASDDAVAHAGDRVGPYRLLHEIGRGGMGSVWLAERADGAYKRQVALKLPRLAWGAGLAERMAREREIGMLLEHPNIARLYDAGVDDRGRPFLALEFIDGQPIDAWCEAQVLGVRERLKLFVQVVKAVAYAHGRLVVHRDLKPSNVLVTPDGQAHLLDFGIAKLLLEAATGDSGLTQEQGRVLTPHYASPEQVAGEAITVQSDVYSLGVLLYELLTGALPFAPRRGTLGALEDAILDGDAPLASGRAKDRHLARALRGDLDAILAKAMQREAARRYATADALALDIERHLDGETVSARPDSAAYRLRKAVRRHWLGVSAGTAVLVAVIAGSGIAAFQAQRAARSAERERVVKAFVADVFRANVRGAPDGGTSKSPSTVSVLEGGAQLIQQRFADQPEMQAELYGVVGGVFSDMGAYRLAADYSTKRVAALAALNADRSEQTQGLLALGQALIDDGKYTEAEPHIREAIAMSAPYPSLHVQALILLALVESELRGASAAFYTTLREIEAKLVPLGSSAQAMRAWALFLRAASDGHRGVEEVVPLFQQAIDLALQAEGPLSMTAIRLRLDVAEQLAYTHLADEAQRQFDAGVAGLRRLGGAHMVQAAFRSAMFAALRYTRRGSIPAREAIATIEHNRAALAAATLPMPEWFIPYVDFYLGLVETNHGNVRRGLELIESSAPILRRTLDTPWDRHKVLRGVAEVLMESGRHELADRHFRETLEILRSIGGQNQAGMVTDYLFIVENLLMQGDVAAATAVLDQAPDYEALRDPSEDAGVTRGRFISNWRLKLRRAQARYHGGDARAALESLPALTSGASKGMQREHAPVLGELLCAAGRYQEGLQTLKPWLTEVTQGDHSPNAPRIARLRAVVGLCAWGAGERAVALDQAGTARAAFKAQPGVSPYYKAPLIKLERALGLKLPPV